MKTKIITALFLLSFCIAQSQTEKKKATVRIKKVEIVDGKKIITDTTFVMDDSKNQIPSGARIIKKTPGAGNEQMEEVIIVEDMLAPLNGLAPLPAIPEIPAIPEAPELPEIPEAELKMAETQLQQTMIELDKEMKMIGKNGVCTDSLGKSSSKRIVVITGGDDDVSVVSRDGSTVTETNTKDGQKHKVVIMVDGDNIKEEQLITEDFMGEDVQDAIKNAGKGESNYVDKVVTVNVKEGKDGKKEVQRIVIIKNVKLTEPNEQDQKMLEKQTGVNDQKLKLDQMNFYPNPNTGKFNLTFNLQDKGDTEINVLNLEGKAVYYEKLKNFTGHYDHEIDISSQPKGVYFVKVAQGAHSYVKKMMIE